jgi:hypothetical protein
MPILRISRPIAAAQCADIETVLAGAPLPPLEAKDMLKLTYDGDDPVRLAAFQRLQNLPGVIVEYQ